MCQGKRTNYQKVKNSLLNSFVRENTQTKIKSSEHSQAECKVLSRTKSRITITDMNKSHPVYQCISPLRGLLLKTTQPKLFEVINSLYNILRWDNWSHFFGLAIQRIGESQRLETKFRLLASLSNQCRWISPQSLRIIRSIYPRRNPRVLWSSRRQCLWN